MTLPAAYFDEMYGKADDPWGFTTRWYEQRKYALTLAALPDPRYDNALEIGCSVGVLTAQLAERCSALLATDVSAAALDTARSRVPETVTLQRGDWTGGGFDLVVLSEVAYYLSLEDLDLLLDRVDASVVDGAVLLACHWRHPVDDYPLTGDTVHEVLSARTGWSRLSRWLDDDVVLDVLVRGRAISVARRTGLV